MSFLPRLFRRAFSLSSALALATAALAGGDAAPATPPASSDSATAPAPAPAAAAPEAPSGAEADLKALVGDITTKLRAGETSPEALAPELKRFDALLDHYAGQKTDAVAAILVSKAMLYAQVFRDLPHAAELLRKVQTDFPDTEVAARCGEVLTKMEPMLASLKVSAALQPGAEFPDFSETALDGQPLSLSAHKGKVVLVDFWATWCGPCVAELPNVLAAYEKYHPKGLEIVGISADRDRNRLETFLKDNNVPWRQFFDGQGWNNKLVKAYGVHAIPATYLLDREGKIVAKDLRGEELEQELAKLLP